MTKKEFNKLKRGDIVLNLSSGNSYIIDHTIITYTQQVTHLAIRTITISNPSEWKRVQIQRNIDLKIRTLAAKHKIDKRLILTYREGG